MWSPTKLDFLFYDFSVIYYDFQRFSGNKLKRKNKTTVTVANHRLKPRGGLFDRFWKVQGVENPVL